MAVTYGFFNSSNGDRKYNADQMSSYFEGLVSDGIYESVGDALTVKAGSGMQVSVGEGRAIIRSKWFRNDAPYIINLNPAHVTLNRYTAICLRLDMEARKIDFYMKDSADATTPVKPTMVDSLTVKEICLAYVYVGRGVTTITQANIEDTRANTNICGWVTGLIRQVDTSELFLQYQAAYEQQLETMQAWQEQQQAAFDTWFSALTEQLQVNTSLHEYKNVVTTSTEVSEIAIGISEFDATQDILYTNINGVQFVENVDYTISGTGATAKLMLTNSIRANNTVEFRVLKSVIG